MPTPRGTPSPLYLPPCPCPWVFRGFCVPGFTLSLLTCHVSCTGINKYYFRLLYSLIMSCHVWRAKTPLAPSGILLPFPDRLPHLLPFVPFPAVAFRAISCRLGLSCYTCPRSPLCDMLPGKYNKPLPVGNTHRQSAAGLTTDERNGREQRETRHADPKRHHGANYGAGISCYTCTGIRAAMCNKLLQVDKRGADQTRSRKNWNRCGRDPGTAERSRSRSGRQGISCYTCILWHYASTAL